MENQVRLKSQLALAALGRLMRRLSKAGQSATMTVPQFEAALQAELPQGKTLQNGVDYEIRSDVVTVRLTMRVPQIVDIYLPEAGVIQSIEDDLSTGKASVRAPWPYTKNPPPALVKITGQEGYDKAIDTGFDGDYEVELDADGFDRYLDPYMAGYVTTQCI